MKTKIVLGTVVTLMLFTSLAAHPPAAKPTRVEARMQEIDLDILLKRYEKVATALDELNFQMGLSQAQGKELSDKDRKSQESTRDFLVKNRDELRVRLSSFVTEQPAAKPTSIEERMREIDLDILLKRYERVNTDLAELRFQMRQPLGEGKKLSDRDRELSNSKEEALARERDEVTSRLQAMGAEEAERAKHTASQDK